MHRIPLVATTVASALLAFPALAQVEPFDLHPEAYVKSDFFPRDTHQCGTGDREVRRLFFPESDALSPRGDVPTGADCSQGSTLGANTLPNSAFYAPGTVLRIPVVVHILMDDDCEDGAMPDERATSQIEILNEDFQALMGSNGANGVDLTIEFFLATEDPEGQPTTGITRTCNTTYYNDGGNYWNELAWDPDNYMNIYTNNASGNLGYVPFLPADSNGVFVGGANDRVVILDISFGRDAPIANYDLGRTATHEVGHYLGLEHVFLGCASGDAPACHSNGDLICDTSPQASPLGGCPSNPMSCSSPDNPNNYMDYTYDACMEEFTIQQGRRMRCSLLHWRPDLPVPGMEPLIFTDGFESGDTTSWSD